MLYLVENEDSPINYWGCYWIVEARNKKEAIDKAYRDGNMFIDSKEAGILKRKLEATRLEDILDEHGVYMIK